MRTAVSRTASSTRIPDGVAVTGLLAATAVAIVFVTLLFAVLRRLAPPNSIGIAAPAVTPPLMAGR